MLVGDDSGSIWGKEFSASFSKFLVKISNLTIHPTSMLAIPYLHLLSEPHHLRFYHLLSALITVCVWESCLSQWCLCFRAPSWSAEASLRSRCRCCTLSEFHWPCLTALCRNTAHFPTAWLSHKWRDWLFVPGPFWFAPSRTHYSRGGTLNLFEKTSLCRLPSHGFPLLYSTVVKNMALDPDNTGSNSSSAIYYLCVFTRRLSLPQFPPFQKGAHNSSNCLVVLGGLNAFAPTSKQSSS